MSASWADDAHHYYDDFDLSGDDHDVVLVDDFEDIELERELRALAEDTAVEGYRRTDLSFDLHSDDTALD